MVQGGDVDYGDLVPWDSGGRNFMLRSPIVSYDYIAYYVYTDGVVGVSGDDNVRWNSCGRSSPNNTNVGNGCNVFPNGLIDVDSTIVDNDSCGALRTSSTTTTVRASLTRMAASTTTTIWVGIPAGILLTPSKNKLSLSVDLSEQRWRVLCKRYWHH